MSPCIHTTLAKAIVTTQQNGAVWFAHVIGAAAQLFKLVPVKNGSPEWLAQKVSGEVYAIPEDADIIWSEETERFAALYLERKENMPPKNSVTNSEGI